MIGYKDMTFCPFYETCENGSTCHRALTQEVKDGAQKWWGVNNDAPIWIFSSEPDCHEKITHD